ncbi:hypothetical protein [Romboutsia sp. Marseille-P6047]|uniref:hypothetical protein n=1 Tax=Romboutsia sp. Marseille-P6047 TaxID=2161817 RepID=UPI000F04DEE8|nr:hypothetical protein [Romboutsia sp. Marseille-P6047]
MVSTIVNFPYNYSGVARLDSCGIVHNHLYHECPVGKVCSNIIYNKNNFPIGRVDENGIVHNHITKNSPIGKVDEDGYVYSGVSKQSLVGRIDGDNASLAGGAYLLLLHNNK